MTTRREGPAPKCACGAPLDKTPRLNQYKPRCDECQDKVRLAMRKRLERGRETPARIKATTKAQRP